MGSNMAEQHPVGFQWVVEAKERGAKVDPIRVSPTKAILSNITDPNGIRIELAELPPESSHRQAMERWK